jgi:hypothetical protein
MKNFGIFLFSLCVMLLLIGLRKPAPEPPPKTEAEIQEEDILKQWKEQERDQERKIAILTLAARKVQRNPTSFQIIEAYIGDDLEAACIVYRSQNGFGGMNRGYVVQASEILLMDHERGFTKAWNGNCLTRTRDLTHYAQYQIGQPRDR